MISLCHSPTLARPNTFRATFVMGLWRLEARVQATGASTVFPVELWAQIHERETPRRKDAEGHPALLLSRSSEDIFTLEPCQLHASLPKEAYLLSGFKFAP